MSMLQRIQRRYRDVLASFYLFKLPLLFFNPALPRRPDGQDAGENPVPGAAQVSA
jgi:hypothetical protein